MIIETKYNVGDTFWVPRCLCEYEIEKMEFEGEVWERKIKHYKAHAKKKEIVTIEVQIYSQKPRITYGVINEGKPHDLCQYYPEDNINLNQTEEDCIMIAQEFARKGQEYFGN